MGIKVRPNRASVELELGVDVSEDGDGGGVNLGRELEDWCGNDPEETNWHSVHEHEDSYLSLCERGWKRVYPAFRLPSPKKKMRVRITIEEIPDGE